LYAQALIEGRIRRGRAGAARAPQIERAARGEGLLGRIEKQRYVNQVLTEGKGQRGQLGKAINAYMEAYEADAGKPVWHAVNAIALLKLGERKKMRHERIADVPRIARAIVKRLQQDLETDKAHYWELATAGEACLALGQPDLAELWYRRAVDADDVEPFSLASSIRQPRSLGPERRRGRRPASAAAARSDARAHIGKQALFTGSCRHPDTGVLREDLRRHRLPESREDSTRPQTLRSGRQGRGDDGRRHRHGLCDPRRRALRELVGQLSDHHEQSRREHDGRQRASLRQRAGDLPCTARWRQGVHDALCQNPRESLRISSITPCGTAEQPPGLEAYPVADALPTVSSGQRLYVIGHPRRRADVLAAGHRLVDHGAPADCRVHYRAPTEPGARGPVFNGGWSSSRSTIPDRRR
jgi:hypothetical protein